MEVTGIILAGGKGLRLGHDKILETIGNRSLLEEVVARIGTLTGNIIIVTAEKRPIPQFTTHLNLTMVTDIRPGKGPLVGIYTGLAASQSFLNVAVASDMPFLNVDLLRYMIEVSPGFDLVVPRVGKLVEPLHAVYTKKCLEPIAEMIKQNNFSVNELFPRVKVRYVEAPEIERFDPQHLSFFNVNTKADLEKARDLSRSLSS